MTDQHARPHHRQYLNYIVNTGSNVDVAGFDDDWEPIGPNIRKELMPTFIAEGPDGKLVLTDKGREALEALEK